MAPIRISNGLNRLGRSFARHRDGTIDRRGLLVNGSANVLFALSVTIGMFAG